MGRLALDGLIGIHTNLLTPALGDVDALSASPPTKEERAALDAARRIPCDRHGLLRGAGNAPGDDRLCPSGFTHRPGGLDDRSRHGRLPKDRPRVRRQGAVRQSHPRTHRRQHHAVLVDRHRGIGGALVLGGRTRGCSCGRPGSDAGLDSGRLHDVPRRDLAYPAQLGRAGIPQRPSTSTRWTRAVTSPPGRNRSSSRKSCAPRSGRCDKRSLSGTDAITTTSPSASRRANGGELLVERGRLPRVEAARRRARRRR